MVTKHSQCRNTMTPLETDPGVRNGFANASTNVLSGGLRSTNALLRNSKVPLVKMDSG